MLASRSGCNEHACARQAERGENEGKFAVDSAARRGSGLEPDSGCGNNSNVYGMDELCDARRET
jgi:hypothetical protein